MRMILIILPAPTRLAMLSRQPSAANEIVLATVPTAHECERLQVVVCQPRGAGSTLRLVQQSWTQGLGWYNQATLELAPEQVRDLKSALRVANVASPLLQESPADPPAEEVISVAFPHLQRAESA